MMIVLRLVYGSYEWQICTQLLRFFMVIYMFLCLMMMIQQNWTKSIIIFIIELGIWVVMAWRPPQYRRGKRTSCTGLMSDHCVVHVVSLRFALPQNTLNPDSSLIIVWRCNGWPYFGDKTFFRCAIISCLQFVSQWVSQQNFFRSWVYTGVQSLQSLPSPLSQQS